VVNAMWFTNKRDEGVVYHEWFNPVSTVMLALILTAVSHHRHIITLLILLYRLNVRSTSGRLASKPTSNSLVPTTRLCTSNTSNVSRLLTRPPRSMIYYWRSVCGFITLEGK
jgi:hypothetical protein